MLRLTLRNPTDSTNSNHTTVAPIKLQSSLTALDANPNLVLGIVFGSLALDSHIHVSAEYNA